jgi:lysophospholipase L1-like esterase
VKRTQAAVFAALGGVVVALLLISLAVVKNDAIDEAVAKAAAAAPPATAPADPTTQTIVPVAIVGDSYTSGDAGSPTWAKMIMGVLPQVGGASVTIKTSAVSGTGYVTHGLSDQTFLDLAKAGVTPESGVVTVFGSRNDSDDPSVTPAEVRSAASETYAAIKQIAPTAKILVIGPPWTSAEVPANVSANRDAVKAAAVAAGAQWVDPLEEGWFFGPDSTLIGPDHTHPTADGQRYLAQKIAPHLADAVRSAEGP